MAIRLPSPLAIKAAPASTQAFAPTADVVGITFAPKSGGTSDSVEFLNASAVVKAGFKSDGTFYSKAGSQFGNAAGLASTQYAGTGTSGAGGTPSSDIPWTLFHYFGQGGTVAGTTQAGTVIAKYFNKTLDDSMEAFSAGVFLVDSGTPYTQTLPAIGLEGDFVAQGSNTLTNKGIGVGGGIFVQNTATVTSVMNFYAALKTIAAGASVTNAYGFYDEGMSGTATNVWSFYGKNDAQFEGKLFVGVQGAQAAVTRALFVGIANDTTGVGTLTAQMASGQTTPSIAVRDSGGITRGSWFGSSGLLLIGNAATGGSMNGGLSMVTTTAPSGTPPSAGAYWYVDPADNDPKVKTKTGDVRRIGPGHYQILFEGLGYKSWAFDPNLGSGGTAPTAGTVYVRAIPLRAGQVITHLNFNPIQVGVGAVPTSITVGLANSSGTIVALSAEQKSNAAWLSTAISQIALNGTYTVPTDGMYYVCFLQVGSWGTTQMTLLKGVNSVGPGGIGTTVFGTGSTTGQSALPAVSSAIVGGIVTTNAVNYWVGAD